MIKKQFKLLQQLIDKCTKHDYNVVKEAFSMKKAYLNAEQRTDYIRKEIFRITEELVAISQKSPSLKSIAFDWHTPNFVWETTFYESLTITERKKYIAFPYNSFEDKLYLENKTSYNESLPYFADIVKLLVYSKYLEDLQNAEKELLTTPVTKETISKPQEEPTSKKIIGKDNPFNCALNDTEIGILADCVNEAHIFTTEITPQILNDLFHCRLLGALKSKNNRLLAYFMIELNIRRYITVIDNVGVVFTEIGARILNPELNKFLSNGNLTENDVAKETLFFQRNCMFDMWGNFNFSFFIKGIHNINKGLPEIKKVKMYPSDVTYIEGEPTEEKVHDMVMNMIQRDSLMGTFIIEKFNEMKNENPIQKALVIMNFRHAYKVKVPNADDNAGRFLAREYPGKVSNVLINTYETSTEDKALQDGKWDAAFKAVNKEDVGFDFRNSPFGDYHFDHFPFETNKNYADMFDGFVFYKPIEKFIIAVGLPGLMDDGVFERTVKEEALYNKIVYNLKKMDIPPVDEERLRNLNEIRIEHLPKLDEIKSSIDKWLK